MLLVVGPVEPTPFGCRLSTLEGWCVACDVADPWPSAAAPLPDIFPSIVYRSSLSLSLPRPCCRSRSCSAGYSLVAGAPKCAKCAYLSLLRPLSSCEKKTTPRHEGCVAPTKRNGTWIGKSWPQYQLAFSTLTRFFYAFVREEPQIYSSSGVPFSGPITGQSGCSHLTGRTSNQLISFPGTKQLPLESALFFFLSMTCGAGLAPPRALFYFSVRFLSTNGPSRLSLGKVAEMFNRGAREEGTPSSSRPGNFSQKVYDCAHPHLSFLLEKKRGNFQPFFFFKAQARVSPSLCCAGELRK